MKIEHLISTMFQPNMDFLEALDCKEDVLIVNQTDHEASELVTKNDHTCRMISTRQRGLSNSRNMLLRNARGDVCIIGDDDLKYVDAYDEKILAAYRDYPEADIIVFCFTQSLEKDTRRQFPQARRLNIFTISKAASVEITFRLESIQRAALSFCPLLGLGAKYGACEENAFLADALRAGLSIWYIPKTICYLKPDPPDRVKWQNGFDEDYFIKRGACFYRIYRSGFLAFSAAFLLLKRRIVLKDITFFRAFRCMLKGKQMMKKEIGSQCF